MPFLPPEAQDALLDNITMLSAAGSQLATESVPDASQAVPRMADRMRQATERWRDHGFDVEMTDLWYGGDRNDVVDYLGSHGWNVSAISVPLIYLPLKAFRSRQTTTKRRRCSPGSAT